MKRIFYSAVILFLIPIFSGCVLWGSNYMHSRTTPEGLYQRGYENYQDGDYKEAVDNFQRLKEEYPLSKYAILAEIGIADSYFSRKDYPTAEIEYQDFIDYHPTNENIPYAMYQMGMCHYKQMMEIDRDQTETKLARESFEMLIARFPTSKFSFMGEKRLKEVRRRLGEHEFYVGHFYYKQKKYKAALKRFELVEKEYSSLGLDYKVSYFLHQTKRRLDEEKGSASLSGLI